MSKQKVARAFELMRFDFGLGYLKSTLVRAAKGLIKAKSVPRAATSPSISAIDEKKLDSDNVQSLRPRAGRVTGTLNGKQAYGRVLGGFFNTLDSPQKTVFARLFPDLHVTRRHLDVSRHAAKRKMKSHIQFLTTPTADTPGTSLLLHFDDKRYLIGNIHEGIQRAGIQFGAKFARVQDIFVTGKTEWQTTGGLLGLVLTLADSSTAAVAALVAQTKKKLERERNRLGKNAARLPQLPSAAAISDSKTVLNIHGGPNLMHLFATARMFIFRKGVPLRVLEHEGKDYISVNPDRDPDWEDHNIRVWNMAITSSATATSPTSPRKRSLTEYSASDSFQYGVDRNQEIRKDVVSEMFESNWRLDNLEEVPLSEVSGPATMFIRDPETRKLQRYVRPPSDDDTPLPNINVLVRKAWPGALIEELPKSKPSPIAMSYIIRNHRQRGKFLPRKAIDLNVPSGPLFAMLVNGESVQSQDGKTITPDMVLGEDKEGGGVAVIDLPSQEYVDGLISRPEWKSQSTVAGVGAVIWLLGASVSLDPRLRQFINDHPQWKHIVSSRDSCANYLAMSSSASSAIRLSRINRDFFPIPVHDNNVLSPHRGLFGEQDSTASVIAAQRGLTCQLEPTFEIQDTAVSPFLNTASILEKMPKAVLDLAKAAKEEIASESSDLKVNQRLPSEDAEIITLGTGSALPSKYRNVSATLLRVPGCGSYLLDCGENTLGQLKRVYGEEGLKEVLHDLKLIWVSHLHADHHLGTISVVKAWRDVVHGQDRSQGHNKSSDPLSDSPFFSSMAEVNDPVKVLEEENRLIITGTGQMMKWLQEYAGVEDFGYDKIVPLESVASWSQKSSRFHLQWHHRHMGFGKEYPKMQVARVPSILLKLIPE